MSGEVLQIDIDAAQRRVERMRFHATTMHDSAQSLSKVMHQAREMGDHLTLGYPSWPALLVDVFGSEPLRLAREVRREVVSEMSEAGASTRAIASTLGVSRNTVKADIRQVGQFDPPETAPVTVDGITADPRTGEVLTNSEVVRDALQYAEDTGTVTPITGPGSVAAPQATEHTVTEKVKTTVGLDGKQYKQKPREPKPVIERGDHANKLNATQECQAIGQGLSTLERLTYPERRDLVLNEWWPLGKHDVTPLHTRHFVPSQLRHIAQGLIDLATEMESHHDYK